MKWFDRRVFMLWEESVAGRSACLVSSARGPHHSRASLSSQFRSEFNRCRSIKSRLDRFIHLLFFIFKPLQWRSSVVYRILHSSKVPCFVIIEVAPVNLQVFNQTYRQRPTSQSKLSKFVVDIFGKRLKTVTKRIHYRVYMYLHVHVHVNIPVRVNGATVICEAIFLFKTRVNFIYSARIA